MTRRLRPLRLLLLLPPALLPLLSPLPAAAETLRCSGGIVSVGDSRLSVLYRCGEPVLKDASCAPVYQAPAHPAWPLHPGVLGLPCVVEDEWLYERGPGRLTAVVRFQSGVVQSIRYGRMPH